MITIIKKIWDNKKLWVWYRIIVMAVVVIGWTLWVLEGLGKINIFR